MTSFNRVRRLLAPLGAALVLSSSPLLAQEIAPSHMEAARAALAAVKATDQFDPILPTAAQGLKQELIQNDPNLEQLIVSTVDEKTIEIAARRADLENEAARIYATAFSEAELREIASFYGSPTGQKLLEQGGEVSRQIFQAAEIWNRGISRDLTQAVAESLGAAVPPAAPLTPEAGAPAVPLTPEAAAPAE